jgi:hypothetical protein
MAEGSPMSEVETLVLPIWIEYNVSVFTQEENQMNVKLVIGTKAQGFPSNTVPAGWRFKLDGTNLDSDTPEGVFEMVPPGTYAAQGFRVSLAINGPLGPVATTSVTVPDAGVVIEVADTIVATLEP